MFGQKKAKNTCEQEAEALYAQVLEQALKPVFYSDYAVPDRFEGRFDLLLLHVFMVMHVNLQEAGAEAINQALFDVLFEDMDQALRQAGKGDMGVPKHMRRMMKAFNGRMNRYHAAIAEKDAFREALMLNLYGEDQPPVEVLDAMLGYVYSNIDDLQKQGVGSIRMGKITFKEIERQA